MVWPVFSGQASAGLGGLFLVLRADLGEGGWDSVDSRVSFPRTCLEPYGFGFRLGDPGG